jgi:hypothetical protein
MRFICILNHTHWIDDGWHVIHIHLHNIDKHFYIIRQVVFFLKGEANRWINFDTCIYINRILIDDSNMKGSPLNAFILCHHVCHFIISFPLIYRRRCRNKPRKRTDEQTVCIYECLWPIGIEHIQVVHTRINGISLSHRHSRLTKKRKKMRERKHYILYWSTDAGRRTRERERKYLPDIHSLILVFSLLLGLLPPLLAAVYEQIEAWIKVYRSSQSQ